ncbi:MAG: cation:proton antiporter [Caldilineaceae bacterium]|nr:cation:proton antiporter [Caldilineaceae bacterium]
MQLIGPSLALFTALSLIVLAAQQVGRVFLRFRLPLISGFLFTGLITGPFVLDFIHQENVPQFLLLDELSLAFIAFAAGAELELDVIRGYLRSIAALIGGQVVAVFAIGTVAFLLMQELIPFMALLSQNEVLAIALLGATIMIARSPSSALAIMKELRARGPFTHKVLGATVLMDAVVIIIFAIAVSTAAALVEGATFNTSLLFFVLFEILLDIGLGILIGLLLRAVSTLPSALLKSGLILLVGLTVFALSSQLQTFHLFSLPIGIVSEPLLICMTAGFYVTNYSRLASDFQHTLETMAPSVFLLFFTLVGIELELDVLRQTWLILLILVVVRLFGILLGSYIGTAVINDKSPGNRYLGLGFITQAGVSVGLAKEIGVEFAGWGAELATLLIGVIVLNQIVGPPLLKWVINRVGEARTRAETAEAGGTRYAVIFGWESQSLAVARQLVGHGWQVMLATRRAEALAHTSNESPPVTLVDDFDSAALHRLNLHRAESVVLMLSDEENYAICELIYEQFGVEHVIVRLQDHTNYEKFQELGALVVQPETAIVSLLDQFVRSPFGASLLLEMNAREVFREIEMNNPDLAGVPIRDIYFPTDVLILSISRRGNRLVSHGYTRLELGDDVTVVGTPDSLAEVEVKFAA